MEREKHGVSRWMEEGSYYANGNTAINARGTIQWFKKQHSTCTIRKMGNDNKTKGNEEQINTTTRQ